MRQPGFLRDRKGAIAIITAVSLMVLVGFAAGAVDFGNVYLKTRQLQGIADLAAMSAAENLDHAQNAAQATVGANNFSRPIDARVVTGTYSQTAAIKPSQRFVPDADAPNAAQVTLKSTAPLYFASIFLGRPSVPITRSATAARAELASFSIGSRLLQLKGGIANALLTALTGSRVELSLMDYQALANTQINLFEYADALKTRLGLGAASYNQTLSADMTTGDALSAIADALANVGNTGAAGAMRDLAASANGQAIDLSPLFDLGPYGDQDYLDPNGGSGVSVNALDLATAVLGLAQGGRQVTFDVATGVPGLAKVTATLAIGQRPAHSPWIAITDKNDVIVRTAQARLYLDIEVVPAGSLLPGVASMKIPLYVELASAQAKLADIACDAPAGGDEVTLSVAPSIGQAALASLNESDLTDFDDPLDLRPFTLVNTPLASVTGFATAKLGGVTWQNVGFSSHDIASGTIKTVKTDDLMQALFSTLLGNLDLHVHILGLGIGLGQDALTAAVRSSLSAVAAPLDGVIDGLTGMLGLGLGEADVRVNGVRCQNVALVR